MRGINFVVAGCMIALAVVQIIHSDSAFKVMADALSVIYTMYVNALLIDRASLDADDAHCRCLSATASLRCS